MSATGWGLASSSGYSATRGLNLTMPDPALHRRRCDPGQHRRVLRPCVLRTILLVGDSQPLPLEEAPDVRLDGREHLVDVRRVEIRAGMEAHAPVVLRKHGRPGARPAQPCAARHSSDKNRGHDTRRARAGPDRTRYSESARSRQPASHSGESRGTPARRTAATLRHRAGRRPVRGTSRSDRGLLDTAHSARGAAADSSRTATPRRAGRREHATRSETSRWRVFSTSASQPSSFCPCQQD